MDLFLDLCLLKLCCLSLIFAVGMASVGWSKNYSPFYKTSFPKNGPYLALLVSKVLLCRTWFRCLAGVSFMDKVLFLSMTGARENMLSQHAHSNNLANINTTGFKTDLAQARAMQVFGEGHPSRVYAQSERPATLRTEGSLIETGRTLDVAIAGKGWLAVQRPDGSEAYTRNGKLHINAANQLVTGNGLPVLSADGAPMVIPPNEALEIGLDGSVNIVPLGAPATELAVVGGLKLVDLPMQTSFKGLDGLMQTDTREPLEVDPTVSVRSGYLESSNVNAVHEMTSIISLARQFELNINMMKTSEEMSEAATRTMKIS